MERRGWWIQSRETRIWGLRLMESYAREMVRYNERKLESFRLMERDRGILNSVLKEKVEEFVIGYTSSRAEEFI